MVRLAAAVELSSSSVWFALSMRIIGVFSASLFTARVEFEHELFCLSYDFSDLIIIYDRWIDLEI